MWSSGGDACRSAIATTPGAHRGNCGDTARIHSVQGCARAGVRRDAPEASTTTRNSISQPFLSTAPRLGAQIFTGTSKPPSIKLISNFQVPSSEIPEENDARRALPSMPRGSWIVFFEGHFLAVLPPPALIPIPHPHTRRPHTRHPSSPFSRSIS